MRLIDADVIKIPKGFFEKVDNVPKFYDWLDDQPTVDPVKHGRWSHHYDDELVSGTCTVCGWQSMIMETDVADMPYCPNCGAQMDLKEEAETEHEQN